jgi:hypothetical protein
MNDYYSEMNPPSEFEIKRILFEETKVEHFSLNDDDIMRCVNKAFEDFGGMKNIGSLTGWRTFSKKELLQMISARLNCKNDNILDTNLNSQAL